VNPAAVSFLGVAAAAMLIDWWAVATARLRIEQIAQPLVMLALIAAALLVDMEPSSLRPWIVVALVAGLTGDVLLLPAVDRFLTGLGAFLIGHLAYVVAFSIVWDPSRLVAIAIVALVLMLAVFGVPIVRAVRSSAMFVPVLAYVAVSATVVLVAAETGRWFLFVGAMTFAASDSILGYDRFVAHNDRHRTLVHMTYHAGQAAILLGTFA
jgi:uncharacterized membrane protein YhhN